MGLTIHYSFKYLGNKPKETLEVLRLKCLELPLAEVNSVIHVDKDSCKKLYELFNQNADDKIIVEKSNQLIGKTLDNWDLIQCQTYRQNYSGINPIEFCLLNLWAGEGCEGTAIILGKYPDAPNIYQGNSFTKTQYATEFIKCHLSIIKVLDYCDELGILKEVSDEGDFWETRNLNSLGASLAEYDKLINSIGNKLNGVFGKDEITIIKSERKELSN